VCLWQGKFLPSGMPDIERGLFAGKSAFYGFALSGSPHSRLKPPYNVTRPDYCGGVNDMMLVRFGIVEENVSS